MAGFTLPKIKAADAIVDGEGKPTIKFLKYFNFDFARAIERNDAAQANLIQDIQAVQQVQAEQLEMIISAMELAQEALDTANNNAGSKVAALVSAPGGSSAIHTVGGVPSAPYLELYGSLTGGSLDADADWLGTATLTESDGASTLTLATIPVVVQSSGEVLPGPTWAANDSSPITFSGFGAFSGTVEYALTVTRDSGSNYVDGAAISATLKITPSAT